MPFLHSIVQFLGFLNSIEGHFPVGKSNEYPLETTRGNGGGVSVPKDYHPYKNKLSNEQASVLEQLMAGADEHQAEVLRQVLAEFTSLPYRQKYAKQEEKV